MDDQSRRFTRVSRWLLGPLLALMIAAALQWSAAGENDDSKAGSRIGSAADKPQLVVTIRPLALIVRELTGSDVVVHELLAASADPHHAALQPSQRLQLEHADLVVWVGPGLEAFAARTLAGFLPTKRMTWLTEESAEVVAGEPGVEAEREAHPHGPGIDPHPWLDPGMTLHFSRRLAAALTDKYPHMATTIASRLMAFEHRLQRQVAALTPRMESLQRDAFIAEHAGYGPFASFFNLREAGSLSDSAGVGQGPKSVSLLQGRRDVACLAIERSPPSRLAKKLASDLQVPIVIIDPFGMGLSASATYGDLLEQVAAGFEQCLTVPVQ